MVRLVFQLAPVHYAQYLPQYKLPHFPSHLCLLTKLCSRKYSIVHDQVFCIIDQLHPDNSIPLTDIRLLLICGDTASVFSLHPQLPFLGASMGFRKTFSARMLPAFCALTGTALCLMILYYHSTSHYTVIRTGHNIFDENTRNGQSNRLGQGPGSEQYAIYVHKLQICLDASNLTNYFRQEDLDKTAVANVKYYLDVLRRFIPNQFIVTLPNHCWNTDVKLDFSSSLVSGYVSGTKFSVDRKDIEKEFPPLNSLPFFGGTNYKQHHYLPLSCIPEVFVSGFHKCGSSYLHSLITSHPAVSRTLRKEAHFFSESNHFANESRTALYFADYIINFELLIEDAPYENRTVSLSVDGSVGMMSRWPDFFGQLEVINHCLLPSVIPEILPKAKFIVVMREPLSMLYSLFWFTCTRFNQPVPSREAQLKGPDIFHERIVAKIRHINSCLTVFPLVKCMVESRTFPEPFHPLMPECGETKMYKALYYVHIQKWLSVIPRERFLFLTMEELSGHLNQTINRVWKFIGVNSFDIKESDENKQLQRAVDYKNDPRLAMRNDTRELLKTFLHPYNQMLADLLGDRKFLWH